MPQAVRFRNGLVFFLLISGSAWGQSPPPPPVSSTAPLRVATRIIPPFVIQHDKKLAGFSIELWKKITEKLKLESEFIITEDVNQLLETVESGKADVGIAAISITSERDRRFEFSQPMFESGLQIMVRDGGDVENDPVSGLVQLLFSPTMLVWLGIAAVMILVPAHILWLLERNHSEGIIPTKNYFPGIFHAAWWAAGTLATQADSMPRNGFARFMAVIWMFTGVVFVAYFTAQVTASLTVHQLKGNIKGPGDLPDKNVATLQGSTASLYLRQKRSRVQEFTRIEEAYGALENEKVDAVVFDAPVLLYHASHEGKGSVQLVGPNFKKENYGIVFPHGSPHRRLAQEALLKLREDGTYDKLYDKWFGGR